MQIFIRATNIGQTRQQHKNQTINPTHDDIFVCVCVFNVESQLVFVSAGLCTWPLLVQPHLSHTKKCLCVCVCTTFVYMLLGDGKHFDFKWLIIYFIPIVVQCNIKANYIERYLL